MNAARNHALDGELLHTYTRSAQGRRRSDEALREANTARRLGVSVEELRELNAFIDRRMAGVPE